MPENIWGESFFYSKQDETMGSTINAATTSLVNSLTRNETNEERQARKNEEQAKRDMLCKLRERGKLRYDLPGLDRIERMLAQQYGPDSTYPHIPRNENEPRIPKENRFVILNSQGVFGKDLGQVLGANGSYTDVENNFSTMFTSFGGQLVYVTGLAENLASKGMNVEISSQIVPLNMPEGHILPDSFTGHQEFLFGNGIVRVNRLGLDNRNKGTSSEVGFENGKTHPVHIDKQAVKDGSNFYYPSLENWARKLARQHYNENNIPKNLNLPYADASYACQFYLNELEKMGVDVSQIVVVSTPHSLGWDKLLRRAQTIKDKYKNDPEKLKDALIEEIDKPQDAWPIRIAAEYLFAENSIVNAASEQESLKKKYGISGDRIVIIPPGSQPHMFYNRSQTPEKDRNPDIEALMDGVVAMDEKYNTRYEDVQKPQIVMRARFDQVGDRKGWAELVNAFVEEKMYEKFNLKLVIQGSPNAIIDFEKFPSQIDGKLTTMGKIREILKKDPKAEKSFVSCQFPSQQQLAAIEQHWGEKGDIIAAIPAHTEPFGLVVPEISNCGIPVVTGQNVGAAELFNEEGAQAIITFDPFDTKSLRDAVYETFERREELAKKQGGIAKKLTWPAVVGKMQQHYQSSDGNCYKGIVVDANNPESVSKWREFVLSRLFELMNL
ncbi:MAG: glycosyltransferase [bacterium]